MQEYITRFAALQAVGDIHPLDYNGQGIVARIKAIPAAAADVVEVVRCRDCFYNRGETKDLWGNPAITCVTAVTHEPDWYCASGKHKAGGRDDD